MKTLHKILVCAVLFAPLPAYTQNVRVDTGVVSEHQYTTKYAWTGENRTFTWCQPDVSTFPGMTWDVQIRHHESGQTVVNVSGLTNTQYVWRPNRTGHYIVRVRNVWNGNISQWSESIVDKPAEGACVEQRGWWLFTWIKPVGGVVPL